MQMYITSTTHRYLGDVFSCTSVFLFIFHHIQLKKNQLNYTLTFALIDPLQGVGRDELWTSWRKAVLTQEVNEESQGNLGNLPCSSAEDLRGRAPKAALCQLWNHREHSYCLS